ncbi:hypothetical protein MMC14_009297 [Varicellaria rhodocarpa]|nr:hypothetical protein [Varicellaria rhodocarpa]
MPSTRITLALNSKQSQKAPLLVPTSVSFVPIENDSLRSLVIKTAQSKLRLKKASRIFIAGEGKELISEQDWRASLKDDAVFLVSAGEEYVGLKKEKPILDGEETPDLTSLRLGNPDCTIVNLADKALIDPLSIAQLETTAHTLPGIIHAVAQPDLHPGTKFPIGAVFVSDGWIHPPLIGGDIGCGMAWYRTTLSSGQVESEKGRKLAESLRGLEGPWRTQENRLTWLIADLTDNSAGCPSAGAEWDSALGTIGAGNHFAELQVVEKYPEVRLGSSDAERMIAETEVVLLVHSGSRGFGGDILKRYTAENRVSMRTSEPSARAYLKEHDQACAWAVRNRDLIALRFLACIEPGEASWNMGINGYEQSPSATTDEQLSKAATAVRARKIIEICHNNVELTTWPPSSSPNRHRKVFIHRKGAAPTNHMHSPLPLPLVPLPGSRGTHTLILRPLFTRTTQYGAHNAFSLAHGAGRAMSRAKALSSLSARYHGRGEDLLKGDWEKVDSRGNKKKKNESGGESKEEGQARSCKGGVWVVCEDKSLVWEEAVEAYKDVWDVADDLVNSGVAELVGWCRGRVSYKVRREGR